MAILKINAWRIWGIPRLEADPKVLRGMAESLGIDPGRTELRPLTELNLITKIPLRRDCK